MYHFCIGRPLKGLQNAAAPTKELRVGSKFGAGNYRSAVVPARELRDKGKFRGQRLLDHPGVPPDAAGRPEPPGYTGGGGGPPPPGGIRLGLYGEVRRGYCVAVRKL